MMRTSFGVLGLFLVQTIPGTLLTSSLAKQISFVFNESTKMLFLPLQRSKDFLVQESEF